MHVDIKQLTRTHRKGNATVEVLRGVDMVLEAGERVAIVGPSGSGKSTFLHAVGLLDRPTSGVIKFDGRDTREMDDSERAAVRNRRVGFVFQAHHLLPEHSAMGNVMVPVRLAGGSQAVAEERASSLLHAVGLGHRLSHRPGELSGGEQQRVAIARALVMGPELVLADEPTGNLDQDTASSVLDLFLELNDQLQSTLVVVTHSRQLADRFPRKVLLDGGQFRSL